MKEEFYQPDYHSETVQFFDEMNLLKSEKNERVKAADYMRKKMVAFFEKVYQDIQDGIFLHEKMDNDYIDDLIATYEDFIAYIDKDIIYDSDIIAKARQFATQIQDTNRNIVLGEEEPEFKNAMMFGLPIKEEIIPWSVKDRFTDEWNAYKIGTNESLFTYNYIRHKEFLKEGRATHTWETMKDERVRIAHVSADGQTVPIDEPFIVGGYKLMYPGDTLTSNPPADLVINCRCLEI